MTERQIYLIAAIYLDGSYTPYARICGYFTDYYTAVCNLKNEESQANFYAIFEVDYGISNVKKPTIYKKIGGKYEELKDEKDIDIINSIIFN